MPLRGVIFDMDGVLWQSSLAHSQAYQEVLTPLGIDHFDYSVVAGQRTRDAIRALVQDRGFSEERIEALAQAKSARALEQLTAMNPVSPHALDVVDRLSARFPVALATSGSASSAALFLDRNQATHKATPLFQAVVTSADVVHAKPSPEIFLAAASRLGIPAEDCLVIEDSVSGIQAARAAGCRVWGFTMAGQPKPLREAGAERVLASLAELLPLVRCNQQRIWESTESAPAPQAAGWTTVIPAAGRGTRLGFDQPKILFPLAGRTILDWLLDLFEPRSELVVIVASPSGRAAIERHLAAKNKSNCRIELQPEPLGMGHAVSCALPSIETPQTLIVWGDQVAIRPETIDACMNLHLHSGALATVPTLWRAKPYIHFERSSEGALSRVLQAREGDSMPPEGESDTGLFLFRSAALRRYLPQGSQSSQVRGRKTGEFNFLPIVPMVDTLPGNVVTGRIVTEEESIGVNTREEAEILGQILLRRMAAPRTRT